MEIKVSGSADLFSFAAALHHAGAKDLSAELGRGLRSAADIVVVEIKKPHGAYFPGAYARTFDSDLSVKPEVRAVSANRITVVAVGKSGPKGRDVRALNAGRLRHPVFGRRRSPWVTQVVRPGWFSDPVERATPAALRAIDAAMGRVAAKINERP